MMSAATHFQNRAEAGRQLAERLAAYRDRDTVVYALPRGGVPVAAEVAGALGAPLDLVIPRKIGHPASPEYAIAAVTERGDPVENRAEVERLDPDWYAAAVRAERREAKRRREAYLGGRPPVDPAGRTAIVVDDGIATGLTMQAAVRAIAARQPRRIVVAVPVIPLDIRDDIARTVDDVVTVREPEFFLGAIGAYYEDFRQTTDDEVTALLDEAARRR